MTKEVTITGWIARDQCRGDVSNLYVGTNKPKRVAGQYDGFGVWVDFHEYMALPEELFHEVKWESEPLEVEITIKRKEEQNGNILRLFYRAH